MKNFKIAIGLGFCVGLLSFFSPGALFSFLSIVLIIFAIRSFSNKDERLFLTRIFIWGIIIRISLLLLVQFIFILQRKWFSLDAERVISLFGDDGMHTIVGWWYAQYASGAPLNSYPLMVVLTGSIGDYGRTGYLYLISLFYYMFGYSPISVIFINCIISVLTGIIYYSIAKKIACINAARITAVFVTFFPSLVIWSSTNLKDPLFIFLSGVVLWLFLQFLENNKIKYLILLLPSIILQFTLRLWILWPTVIILGMCYLIMKKKIKIMHILLCIIILFSILPIFKDKLNEIKGALIDYHIGVVNTGGFTYRIYDDWIYQSNIPTPIVPYSQILKGYLRGWLHFFLEPFPWNISSKLSLASFPQMLILYFLIPFSALGMLIQLRYNWKKSLVFIVYFVTMGSILSFTGGNIGTIFRIRDFLTPLILSFSSIGLIKIFYFKQNIPEDQYSDEYK